MPKEYEECNTEEQRGWAVGQDEFINGDLPGGTLEEFMLAFKGKYATETGDFQAGAELGVRGEM